MDRRATPRDYDSDPNRFRQAARGTSIHLTPGANLYAVIAGHLADLGADRVLDIGCGEGALGGALDHGSLVSLDASMSLLRRVRGTAVQADAGALPFPDYTFDAAVAVNVFDHLTDPVLALREARRVLRPGGALIAGGISHHDSPELAPVWRPQPTPFDSEDAPALMQEVFDVVQVESWDEPLITLPNRDAVRDYLIARFVPRRAAEQAARRMATPLRVTKRGALVIGRRDYTPSTRLSGSVAADA